MTEHADILAELAGLLEGEADPVARAANTAALIFARVRRLNWAGFYYLRGDMLVVGPFQGLPACTRIPLGTGVCGIAAQRRQTIVVPDVHAFPGHIACDGASLSEIVVPFAIDGRLAGVLDIDSPEHDRFSAADQAFFEAVAGRYADGCTPLRSDRCVVVAGGVLS